MRTIAHISDLHFGREDPSAAEALAQDLWDLQPTVVVNSGDFTQRARRGQFTAAAGFIGKLPQPQIAVPGNHDIPLYDVLRRFLSPLGRYRRFITEDLYPKYEDEEISVIGINTARSFTWKNGRISVKQIEAMAGYLALVPEEVVKVVVTHHPFIPPPGEEEAGVALVGRARRALDVIDRCGVDLLLAGHLHHGYTGDVRTYYPSTRRSIVVAQAGTAISHRVRHEPNGYNWIEVSHDQIAISVRRLERGRFRNFARISYRRKGDAWVREEDSGGDSCEVET